MQIIAEIFILKTCVTWSHQRSRTNWKTAAIDDFLQTPRHARRVFGELLLRDITECRLENRVEFVEVVVVAILRALIDCPPDVLAPVDVWIARWELDQLDPAFILSFTMSFTMSRLSFTMIAIVAKLYLW